jgi:carbon storage regulator CsrA
MLVLWRRTGESIVCVLPDGEEIIFRLLEADRTSARIGVEAPDTVRIIRRPKEDVADGE